MNNIVEQVVDRLLEVERACAGCQAELGIKPTPGTSHGSCYRHALKQWASVPGCDLEQAKVILQSKPLEYFCPDLSPDLNQGLFS